MLAIKVGKEAGEGTYLGELELSEDMVSASELDASEL